MNSSPHMVNAYEVLRQSKRFDLIFKIELAWAWAYGSKNEIIVAEEAYLEHIRAHNGFCEKHPLRLHPFDFIRDAFSTMRSILRKGFDPRYPIPLSSNGELLGGAHRLAACVAYRYQCVVRNSANISLGTGNSFASYLESDIHPSVLKWGIDAYYRRVPDGCLINEFPEIQTECDFPDWTTRFDNQRMPLSVHLDKWYHKMTIPFRKAKSKTKSEWKVTKINRRACCMKLMAQALKNRWRIIDDEIRFGPVQ